jgi:hypothetical protein
MLLGTKMFILSSSVDRIDLLCMDQPANEHVRFSSKTSLDTMRLSSLPLTFVTFLLTGSLQALSSPMIAEKSPTTTTNSVAVREKAAIRKLNQARQYNPRAPRVASWKRQTNSGTACPA